MKQKNIVIIGGGIGGIGAANLLAKAGHTVTLYEANDYLGGRAGLLKKDGFTFDSGPSWYLMPEVFEHYYNLLDREVDQELDIIQLKPAYKVFFDTQKPIEIRTEQQHDEAVFEKLEAGSTTAFRNYVAKSNHIYQLAMRHFLYTNFTSFRDFLSPTVLKNTPRLLAMALTPLDKYISRSFTSKYIKQILEYPMVFLGASPFEAPSIYSLMSALDYSSGVFYPRGGMYTIIESLVRTGRELGVTFNTNSPVKKILVNDGDVAGVELEDGKRVTADIVISNADTHFTETRLLEKHYQTYPEKYWVKKSAGPSALLLYLGVKGGLDEFEHHNLFFVDEWKENFDAIYKTHTIPERPSIYVSKTSQTDPGVAPNGHEALFVLVPLPAGVDIGQVEQQKLADSCIVQIEKMSGVDDLAKRIISKTIYGPDYFASQFHAWKNTALGPAHTLSQSALFRTKNKSKKVRNLYYVGGSTLPGIGLPMCLIGAELIYKHIVGEKKGGMVKKIERVEI